MGWLYSRRAPVYLVPFGVILLGWFKGRNWSCVSGLFELRKTLYETCNFPQVYTWFHFISSDPGAEVGDTWGLGVCVCPECLPAVPHVGCMCWDLTQAKLGVGALHHRVSHYEVSITLHSVGQWSLPDTLASVLYGCWLQIWDSALIARCRLEPELAVESLQIQGQCLFPNHKTFSHRVLAIVQFKPKPFYITNTRSSLSSLLHMFVLEQSMWLLLQFWKLAFNECSHSWQFNTDKWLLVA